MNAFWQKVFGSFGVAVLQSYLEQHPTLMPIIASGEESLILLRQAIKNQNLIAAALAVTDLETAWGQLTAELKK